MSFTNVAETRASYVYKFRPIRSRDSTIQCGIQALGEASLWGLTPGQFKVDYKTHGIAGWDDWYVLSHPHPDFALIYYYGESQVDRYQGAVVMARDRLAPIPAFVIQDFRDKVKSAGLAPSADPAGYCLTDNQSCSVD
jgi:hypothetical protein